ncbi:putative transmembrane protein 217B [Eptesicus fuscus]|uniref:putative transmembrane protein 217B n=1 Tax=Eptesicus fuscus TaxID=29078 RepID=UPI00046BB46A|nr:putative transmembrane protein 217B [Eptesicus fuscus]XP_028017004.1 putative transmembrane protein 217B [Eptesicus fuscus]
MNDKLFSLLVGIFSILNTIQFLIFDLNELTFIGYEDRFSVYMDGSVIATWVLTNKKNISISLSTITILVSAFLLYSIHLNVYQGLLCYALWIISYELTSFSMVLLLNAIIKEQFKELGYVHLVFQISRMLLHFFCLPFIIKHTYNLYRDPKTFSKISRRRLSSITTLDSWSPVAPGMMYRKLN